jgi:hypothetical protein
MRASFHDRLVTAISTEFPEINVVALSQIILHQTGNTVWRGYGVYEIRSEILQMSDFCWDRQSDWDRVHPAFGAWAKGQGVNPTEFVTEAVLAPYVPLSQNDVDRILETMQRELDLDRGLTNGSVREAINWEMSERIEQYVMSAIDRLMMTTEIRKIIQAVLEEDVIVHDFTQLLNRVRYELYHRLNQADYHRDRRFYWNPTTPVAHVALEHRGREFGLGETPDHEPVCLFTLAVEQLLGEGRIVGKLHELGVNRLTWIPEKLEAEPCGDEPTA